jgi:hypothetical protein
MTFVIGRIKEVVIRNPKERGQVFKGILSNLQVLPCLYPVWPAIGRAVRHPYHLHISGRPLLVVHGPVNFTFDFIPFSFDFQLVHKCDFICVIL